ncbi:hypothetical protein VPHD148_0142 [Vibrio phage D148]
MNWDTEWVLPSAPPKYEGRCKDCGEIHRVFCFAYDGEPEPAYFTERKTRNAARNS